VIAGFVEGFVFVLALGVIGLSIVLTITVASFGWWLTMLSAFVCLGIVCVAIRALRELIA